MAVAQSVAGLRGREVAMPLVLWADGRLLIQVFSPLVEETTLLALAESLP